MVIEPIQDCLIVLPDTPPTHTPSGLEIPQTARQIILTGVVLTVGPGRELKEGGPIRPVAVQPGERVLYERQMGTELKSQGQRVLLLREQHVLGVLASHAFVEIPLPPPPPQDMELGSFVPDEYAV